MPTDKEHWDLRTLIAKQARELSLLRERVAALEAKMKGLPMKELPNG